ncbi:hypothetical protein [Streptomyces sp. A012304]|uniref:hypothetical protein n=1 Tax=Streptomyces sp. A012304 TaxID=375446 RepID=UPI002852BAAC|nr:hypothetical protein [Streptomyces sp. A012304]
MAPSAFAAPRSEAFAAPREAAPSCVGQSLEEFPLTTRLRGGPATYRAGGGYGVWYLDLTNITRRPCAGVHPVVVLVDAERTLKPSQPRLEFYADGDPHAVRFEETDADELVGVLTGETTTPFRGFTVAAGRTLTVKLRLAFTSDAEPDEVTVNAAVVQRQGSDGEWVGQSNDYTFLIEPGTHSTATEPGTRLTTPEPGTHPTTPEPGTHPTAPEPDTGLPSLAEEAEQLARTGLASPAVILTTTTCLVAAGAALLLSRRR